MSLKASLMRGCVAKGYSHTYALCLEISWNSLILAAARIHLKNVEKNGSRSYVFQMGTNLLLLTPLRRDSASFFSEEEAYIGRNITRYQFFL
jgi:hypothetical protein